MWSLKSLRFVTIDGANQHSWYTTRRTTSKKLTHTYNAFQTSPHSYQCSHEQKGSNPTRLDQDFRRGQGFSKYSKSSIMSLKRLDLGSRQGASTRKDEPSAKLLGQPSLTESLWCLALRSTVSAGTMELEAFRHKRRSAHLDPFL